MNECMHQAQQQQQQQYLHALEHGLQDASGGRWIRRLTVQRHYGGGEEHLVHSGRAQAEQLSDLSGQNKSC
jgi:hypothetical protein